MGNPPEGGRAPQGAISFLVLIAAAGVCLFGLYVWVGMALVVGTGDALAGIHSSRLATAAVLAGGVVLALVVRGISRSVERTRARCLNVHSPAT